MDLFSESDIFNKGHQECNVSAIESSCAVCGASVLDSVWCCDSLLVNILCPAWVQLGSVIFCDCAPLTVNFFVGVILICFDS